MIEAFRIVRERVPDAQLVLAGSMATDDPEGFRVWDETEAARAGDRDIYLLSNLHQVGSVQINAFQRVAEVVLQKSLREGFGLTVSEGLWKGRPVDRRSRRWHQAADPRRLRRLPRRLGRGVRAAHDRPARRPRRRRRAGSAGARARARELPLDARAPGLADAVRDPAQVMLVTHRGPYRFSERDDGSFAARRGAGGLVSALLPLVQRDDIGARPSWVAAAIDDGDRAAVAGGAATVPGLDLHLLDLDPALHRMHYDVISNAVLWFLHHGLFDLARRPRFDRHLREAWDGYVAVNAAFADVVVRGRAGGRAGARARLPPRARCRAWCAPSDPTCCSPTSPTRRSADPTRSGCCPPTWPRRSAPSMGAVTAGFHTDRWAAAYTRVGARGPRARRRRRRTPRRSGPTPRRWPSSPPATAPAARPPSSTSWSATASCCSAATASTCPRTSCAASTCTTRCSTRTRSAASGSCSSPCSTGRAPTWPSTSRTSRRSTRPRRG